MSDRRRTFTARSALRAGAALLTTAVAATPVASCGNSTSAPETTNRTIPTFTFALGLAPVSLDLAKQGNVVEVKKILSLVTEPLERLTPTGETLPNLAASARQPNPTTIVYTIRGGIRFSNGAPLTPQDVAWSIDHATEPSAQTASGDLEIASVTVTGPREVTVKAKAYDPTMRAQLADVSLVHNAKFARANRAELGTANAMPVGTGPYRFESYSGESVTLVRNPRYWGRKAAVDKLVCPTIAQDTSAQLAMRSGSIQAATVQNPAGAGEWERGGATLHTVSQLDSNLLSMDTSKPPFDDVHVRKAVAHSIDRAGVAKAAYGKYATLLKGLVPAGELSTVAPSPEAAEDFLAQLPQYDLDLEKAKTELASSRHSDGFSLTVPYNGDSRWSQLAVLNLQQNMKQLGVTIKPKPQTGQQWGQALFSHTMTGLQLLPGFGAVVPDPNNVVGGLTGKVNIGPHLMNIANWVSPTVERARATMLRSSDTAARWEATQQVLTAIATEVPYVPLFSAPDVHALAKGFTYTKRMSVFDFMNGSWIFHLKATA